MDRFWATPIGDSATAHSAQPKSSKQCCAKHRTTIYPIFLDASRRYTIVKQLHHFLSRFASLQLHNNRAKCAWGGGRGWTRAGSGGASSETEGRTRFEPTVKGLKWCRSFFRLHAPPLSAKAGLGPPPPRSHSRRRRRVNTTPDARTVAHASFHTSRWHPRAVNASRAPRRRSPRR